MREKMTAFFGSRFGIIAAGAVIGVLAALLQKAGNPPNMGICVACFQRDIAGALGLHRFAPAQYIRPELIGFVLGAALSALLFGEFRSRAGPASLVKFLLGAFAMIGAMAFLGCSWRMIFRLAGGDMNALVGIAGFAAGIFAAVGFMKGGFTLGRRRPAPSMLGWIVPLLSIGLLLLLLLEPVFFDGGPVFFSAKGPGAMHAPLLISLGAGLAVGFLAQRTRFCTVGAFRDVFLMGNTHLLGGVAAMLASAFLVKLGLGLVQFGAAGQPIAHSDPVWNFAGMVLSGLAFALAGGCPGRQVILSGEGDGDAGVFVLGAIAGAAFSHNFALAAVPDQWVDGAVQVGGLAAAGKVSVIVGLVACACFGVLMREKDG